VARIILFPPCNPIEREVLTVAQAIPLESTSHTHHRDRVSKIGAEPLFLGKSCWSHPWLQRVLCARRKLANCL